MRIFELSPRLLSLAELVPRGARFADIGTDHAYLPVWLILQGQIEQAIAADLREGPLNRARQTAERFDVAEHISFRLCDGLSAVKPEEVDAIAIAGMGGETIAEILAAAPWTAEGGRQFLLQPMTAQAELRAWLSGHGFRVEREVLTCEGKTIYSTFLVAPGREENLSPAEIWAGRQRTGEEAPLRGKYLDKLLRRAERALEGLRRSVRPDDASRCAEMEEVVLGLRRMKEEWDLWQR